MSGRGTQELPSATCESLRERVREVCSVDEVLDTLVGQRRRHGQHVATGVEAAVVSHESDFYRNALR